MIVDLPTPTAKEEISLHRVGSWDDEGPNPNRRNLQPGGKLEESLCPHAVSFGSVVYGIRQVWKEGDHWLTWKTSFAPFRVVRVTSNADGSIIVCSTDAETVALLRGTDGAVLATRKVPNGDGSSTLHAAHASIIAPGPNCPQNERKDAVLIRIPSASGKKKTTFVLVSNIDARSLNSTNPIKVADAARGMAINSTLNFQTGDRGDRGIVSCCGYFLDQIRIRFLVLDDKGCIACHDYAGPGVPPTTVEYPVQWSDKENCSIDLTVGLKLHNHHNGAIYVMFATAKRIFFLNPSTLKIAGSFKISSAVPKDFQPAKLLSLEPMESALPETGVATALVLQPNSNNGAIASIMETSVEDQMIDTFHQVYLVPIEEKLQSFAAYPGRSHGSYSFRFKVAEGLDNCACKVFLSSDECHDGSTIGIVRLLIACERFDEADSLINNAGESALISDNFACFHPSEVALGRLKYLLKQGNVSEKASMAQARQCFHRLSSGCISGNERAGQNLLDAAESIAKWASPTASKNPPTLMEISAAISTVSKVLGEVLKMLPADRHSLFVEKQTQLQDQLATLRHLSSILPANSEEKLTFERRFQGSRNPGEFFASLVANENFSAAEGLWNSLLRKKIYPDDAIKAIVSIRANADPNAYLGMLEEFIIPSLSRTFHLLPPLWTWSCQLADEMDDNGDLNKAIDLLQVRLYSCHIIANFSFCSSYLILVIFQLHQVD
jgi:hypothetical protein